MVNGCFRSGLAVALLLAWGAAAPVAAAAILQVNNGILVGATGVNVNGSLYDVSFTDGSCATAYDGCDAVSDLTFSTLVAAQAASQALLDQVFSDGASGLFDTVPSLTFGCTAATNTYCAVWTPFSTGVQASLAYNLPELADVLGGDGTLPTVVFSEIPHYVLADWTPAATPVPEPASMLLLGTGLLGAGVRRWRQRNT